MSKFLIPNISILDESLNLNSTLHYHLAIQCARSACSFSITDIERNKVLCLISYAFDPADDRAAMEYIEKVWLTNEILKKEFKATRVIFEGESYTFIPQPLYNKEKIRQYLDLNCHCVPTDLSRADFLPNMEAYNVYVVNSLLADKMVTLFPHARTCHFMSSLIENLLIRYKNVDLENTVFTYVRSGYFDIVHINRDKLVYANSFRYRAKEDLVYFLIFVLQQLGLNPEQVNLRLLGEVTKDSLSYEFMYRYIRNIKFEDRDEWQEFSYKFDELAGHMFYNLLNVFRCE